MKGTKLDSIPYLRDKNWTNLIFKGLKLNKNASKI